MRSSCHRISSPCTQVMKSFLSQNQFSLYTGHENFLSQNQFILYTGHEIFLSQNQFSLYTGHENFLSQNQFSLYTGHEIFFVTESVQLVHRISSACTQVMKSFLSQNQFSLYIGQEIFLSQNQFSLYTGHEIFLSQNQFSLYTGHENFLSQNQFSLYTGHEIFLSQNQFSLYTGHENFLSQNQFSLYTGHEIFLSQNQFSLYTGRLVTLLENVVGNASVVTILAISIERHRVAYNFSPATASYCSVIKSFLAIWLTSLLGALPILFITQFQSSHFADGTPVQRCTTNIDQTWHKVYTVLGNLIFYIMPLFLILLLYTKVYMKLMMLFRREQEKFKYPREIIHLKRQMIQIIITVVLVFFLSHTPYRTIAMWTMFSPAHEAETMDAESFLTMIYLTKLLLYSNHAINPFVYNFVSRKFRRALAWICCVKRHRNARGDDSAINPKHLLRNDSLRQPRHSPPLDRCYDLDYFLRDKGREEQEVLDRHSQRNDFMVLYEHLLLK
nr:trissin receptor [Biomphalaria glabrata]